MKVAPILAGFLIVPAGLLGRAATSSASDSPPAWAHEALSAPTPTEAIGSGAAVLLRTGSIEMTGPSAFVESDRRVIRILSDEGRTAARARIDYRTDAGKVLSLKAWVVSPTGEAHQLPEKNVIDASQASGDVYSEARVRALSGESDAGPGATFIWESTVERREPFAQFEWYFQDDLPTVRSEFAFHPLPGWNVRAAVFNGDSLGPVVREGWFTWTRTALAPIKEEPYSLPLSSTAARLAVSALPPVDAPASSMKYFARWSEVAAWLHQVAEPSGAVTPAVATKAKALTANASTKSQAIRRIADYCQSVNYVSIQMGLSRGGGYVPHAADAVLRLGYGDCKDKANLMRTMLRTLGIESYLCAISAFDPDYVRESWPTPDQFDHCILAVRSDDSAAAVVSSTALGRLVLFDPTDPTTRWGTLPETERGGWALLVAPAGGELVRVPTATPAGDRDRRLVEAILGADGSIAGRIDLVATGTNASYWRSSSRERGATVVAATPSLWLGATITAATIDSFAQVDSSEGDSYKLHASFRIPRFGRPMGGTLLIVDAVKLSIASLEPPPEKPRSAPMLIPRIASSDELRLSLPPGYGVDALPPAVSIEGPYGSYKATYRAEGSLVALDRDIDLHRSIVPPAESAAAREFLRRVKQALDTPLVLAKR